MAKERSGRSRRSGPSRRIFPIADSTARSGSRQSSGGFAQRVLAAASPEPSEHDQYEEEPHVSEGEDGDAEPLEDLNLPTADNGLTSAETPDNIEDLINLTGHDPDREGRAKAIAAAIRDEEETAPPPEYPEEEKEGLAISQKLNIKDLPKSYFYTRPDSDTMTRHAVRRHIYSYLVKMEPDPQFKPLQGNAVLYRTSHRMQKPAHTLMSSANPAADLPRLYFQITTFTIELTPSGHDFTTTLMQESRFAALLQRIEKLELVIKWATPELLDTCKDPSAPVRSKHVNDFATSNRHHRVFLDLEPAAVLGPHSILVMRRRTEALTRLLSPQRARMLRTVKISWIWNRWVEFPRNGDALIRSILKPLQTLGERDILLQPGKVQVDILGPKGDLAKAVKKRDLPGVEDAILNTLMSVCLNRR